MTSDDAAAPPRLARFLGAMASLAELDDLPEAERVSRARAHLEQLIAVDDWLDEAFAQPDPVYYRQYLLYCDPLRRFSVVSFVWGPGQQTPIHDHTVWGLVGVLRGAEMSEAFEFREGRPIAAGETRLSPGEVDLVSPRTGDVHRVRNAFDDRVSISIHVYGGDIGAISRHVFTPAGEIKPFVSGYSNRYLPNVWGRP